MKVTIVLIEPETDGNIGAIARSMANFGSKNLVIVNPKTNHLSKTSRDRASHARYILENAKIIKETDFSKIESEIRGLGNHILATTAKLGKDYNISRSVELINEIAPKIVKNFDRKSNVVIMFGRESCGLTNEELSIANYSITIPSDSKYPVLNLSHAVHTCLYEFFVNFNKEKIPLLKPKQAGTKELDRLNMLINETLDNMTFVRKTQKDTQKLVFKKLVSKMMLTRREVFSLMGYFKKVLGRR